MHLEFCMLEIRVLATPGSGGWVVGPPSTLNFHSALKLILTLNSQLSILKSCKINEKSVGPSSRKPEREVEEVQSLLKGGSGSSELYGKQG